MTTVTVSRATPCGRHRMGADAFQPIFYARSTSDLSGWKITSPGSTGLASTRGSSRRFIFKKAWPFRNNWDTPEQAAVRAPSTLANQIPTGLASGPLPYILGDDHIHIGSACPIYTRICLSGRSVTAKHVLLVRVTKGETHVCCKV
jgi:hypothetical protein